MGMLARLELEPRPLLRAAAATGALCGVVALGSRGGRWIDPALLGYLIASVFACFGVAYRYFTWLERPGHGDVLALDPARLPQPAQLHPAAPHRAAPAGPDVPAALHRQALHQALGRPRLHRLGLHAGLRRDLPAGVRLGPLHQRRGRRHPLPGLAVRLPRRQLPAGFAPGLASPSTSWTWPPSWSLAGCALAFLRRSRDEGDSATQRFDLDILPLLLLIAVSVTGLLLTASETWLQGRNFGTLAFIHEMTVILMLLFLPFGKLFHIVQRPAQAGRGPLQGRRRGHGRCCPAGPAAPPSSGPTSARDLERLWRELDLDGARHGTAPTTWTSAPAASAACC